MHLSDLQLQIWLCRGYSAPSLLVGPTAQTTAPIEIQAVAVSNPGTRARCKRHWHGIWLECEHSKRDGFQIRLRVSTT